MKKKLIIIFSILAVLILAGVGAYIWYYVSTPQKSLRTANQTMRSLLAGDTESLTSSYDGAKSLPNSIQQRNYRPGTTATEKDIFYIRYAFTDNETPKFVRVGVQDGTKITAIDYGDKVAAVPSKDGEEEVAEVSENLCLTKDDLAYLDSTKVYAHSFRGATMIFAADEGIDYAGVENGDRLLTRMANFYTKAKTKDFYFELKGYRETTDENKVAIDLISARASKIQADLNAKDVPLDRIKISTEYNYSNSETSISNNKNWIDINVVNSCIKN